MSMSPFEVRLDILKMAKDMLEEESRRKVQALTLENASLLSQNQWADNSNIINSISNSSYTTEELKSRASELYEFVKSKS